MKYDIFGGMMPAVTVTLSSGESIYTQSGGMSWMTDGLRMETNTKGGLMKGLGRMLGGDSLFVSTYTAERANAQITFAATMPGEIKVLQIGNGIGYIAQKGAFLAAESTVETANAITKAKSGFFGGEGFILQTFRGSGLVFLELDGSIKEIDLAAGETIKVDTGNVALFESTVTYSAETVKGVKNIFLGGEGLFLTVLRGPGKVWLQTMTASELAGRIVPFLPTGNN